MSIVQISNHNHQAASQRRCRSPSFAGFGFEEGVRGREGRPLAPVFVGVHLYHSDRGDALGLQMLKFKPSRFPSIGPLKKRIKFPPRRLHGPCPPSSKVVDGCFRFPLEEFDDGWDGIVHVAPMTWPLFQNGRFFASTCFHP